MERGRPAARPPAGVVKVPIPCGGCGATIHDADGHRATCRNWGAPLLEIDLASVADLLVGERGDQHGELGNEPGQGLLDHGIALLRLLGKHQGGA